MVLARHGHQRGHRDRPALEEQVPIRPLESQLADVIQVALLEEGEGAHTGDRVLAGERLSVVVEVDEQALAVTALDEAVGVAVERLGESLAFDVRLEVVIQMSMAK